MLDWIKSLITKPHEPKEVCDNTFRVRVCHCFKQYHGIEYYDNGWTRLKTWTRPADGWSYDDSDCWGDLLHAGHLNAERAVKQYYNTIEKIGDHWMRQYDRRDKWIAENDRHIEYSVPYKSKEIEV